MSKNDFLQYEKANKIEIENIVNSIKDKSSLKKIDKRNNIHLVYGNVYNYTLNYFNDIRLTHQFFNDNFWTNFDVKDEIRQFNDEYKKWIIVKEWPSFFYDWIWYYTIDKDWNKKIFSDFYLKVHYKIKKSETLQVFIISIINEKWWCIVEKIERTNTVSKNNFWEYLQKLWNFHFFWWNSEIWMMHSEISKQKVPTIEYVIWYWLHEEENIIIFKNWIWDLWQKIFTEKDEDQMFHLNYNWKWYFVSDKLWVSLSTLMEANIPSLNSTKTIDILEAFELWKKLYADTSWIYLIMIWMAMVSYMLFWNSEESFPIIFTRWITW